ncbi:hypothetical protein TNCV_4407721 [Trichonephila clavipes]|nr:hypothetical protein TNCV_4407721 [Trichonephila clavipes]
MNHDLSFITSMVVSGCSDFHSRTAAPSMYTDWRWRYYALENFLLGDSGILKSGNGISQQDNVPCQRTRIVLEGSEKHEDEFQFMS